MAQWMAENQHEACSFPQKRLCRERRKPVKFSTIPENHLYGTIFYHGIDATGSGAGGDQTVQ